MTIRSVELAARCYADSLEKLREAIAKHEEAERVLEHTTENRRYYTEEVTKALKALADEEDACKHD